MNHTLSNINKATRIGDCSVCGPDTRLTKRDTRRGVERLRCGSYTKRRDALKETPHRRTVADRLALMMCERPGCGFVAESRVQLDVDHIIRKTKGGTNDADNLMVLCANCHRLKTNLEMYGKKLHDKT